MPSEGIARLVLGFQVAGMENGARRLTTETRVFCPDRASRRQFTPYWWLIRPVSGLLRRRMLSSIKAHSEGRE
ncbi:hypothetical protein [Kushneria aurantia]|uniref:DUF2867 domain-containing protein n=1 Tax=Kushneria aurantia TaxID=504092 RepID=A0ABV6G083_9GAMM|nr:hypothetical protein [Kushneria aurantia]